MNQPQFLFGEVISVDAANRKIFVSFSEDALPVEVPLDMPQSFQTIPIVGQQVLVVRVYESDLRLVGIFGHEPLNIQASRPLNEGEVMVQGTGGAFTYADRAGNIMISDKTLSNFIQLLVNTRITMIGDALQVEIKDVGQITITPTDLTTGTTSKISIVKTVKGGIPIAKIVLEDGKITIDGLTVNIGTAPIGGMVVSTSGIPGPYSFDSFGKPIPSSLTVKGSL